MTDCVYLSSSLGISAQAPQARGRGRERQGHASRDGHWSWPMLPRAPWHLLTAPPAKRARPSWHPRFEGLVLDYGTKAALDGHVDTVDTTKEAVSCSICLHPAFGGVITPCQHLFHEVCLETYLATTRKRCCAYCRQSLPPQGHAQSLGVVCRPLQNVLEKMRVKCSQGCGSQVQWGELRSHVLHTCVKSKFSCPHEGCPEAFHRNDLETHLAACEHGMTMCDCGEEVVRRLLPSHRATTCPTQKVECQYCVRFVERGKMHWHHREECQGLAPVSLLFRISDRLEERLDDRLRLAARQQLALRDRIKRCGLAFRLDLPTAIQSLVPPGLDGVFQRDFGDGWLLLVRSYQEPDEHVRVGLKHAAKNVHVRLVVIRLGNTSLHLRRTWTGPCREIGVEFTPKVDFAPELEKTVWIQIRLCDWELYETIQLS